MGKSSDRGDSSLCYLLFKFFLGSRPFVIEGLKKTGADFPLHNSLTINRNSRSHSDAFNTTAGYWIRDLLVN
jgi:hypothetical protein